MKKGWQTKTIGDVCDVMNGGTPKTGVLEYWDGNHRWITPAEMGKRLSPYVGDTERKITDLGLRDSSARMLPPNSVILSSRAPIGHLVINTEPMGTNQGCKGLIPRSQIEHKFLYYYLSSIVDLLNSLGTGATFKELSGGKLKEVTVPVPPLAEQQRIVGLLDEAFEGLATAKANAEKNLRNARALFASHLQTVFTQGGPGWVTKTFGEVLEIRNGRNQLEVESPDGEFPIYGSAGKVMGMATDYICEAGTTIIGRKGNINSPIYADTRFWNVDTAFGLASKAGMDSRFLYFFCLSYDFSAHNRGTTIPSLVKSELLNIPIPVPPPAEQQRIVGLLDSLQEETQRLARFYERKHAALEALKKSLLHQAFTGAL